MGVGGWTRQTHFMVGPSQGPTINGFEIQVAFVDEKPDPSISTFRPLDQHVKLFQIIDAKMCVVLPLNNISVWSNPQRWEAVKCTMGTVIWAAMVMFPAK